MRKLLLAVLAIALLCTLCACGGGQQSQTEPRDNSQAAEPAAPADTAPAPAAPAPETPEPAAVPAPAEDSEPEEPAPEIQPADGAKPAAGDPAPSKDPAPAEEPPKQEEPAKEEPAPAAKTPEELKAIAEGLVGRPVSELYAAIGRPVSSDYAPSCLIDGEDGELTYSGFVVYTERGADYETVYAVF